MTSGVSPGMVIVYVTGTRCGDIVIFECVMGYYMISGGQQRTAVCLGGQWTVQQVTCLGAFMILVTMVICS